MYYDRSSPVLTYGEFKIVPIFCSLVQKSITKTCHLLCQIVTETTADVLPMKLLEKIKPHLIFDINMIVRQSFIAKDNHPNRKYHHHSFIKSSSSGTPCLLPLPEIHSFFILSALCLDCSSCLPVTVLIRASLDLSCWAAQGPMEEQVVCFKWLVEELILVVLCSVHYYEGLASLSLI